MRGIALALALSGCSFVLSQSPPPDHRQREYFTCSGLAEPIVDLGIAAGWTFGGIAEAYWARSNSDSGVDAAALLITAGAYAASAIYGFWISDRCDEDHAELLHRIRPLAERLFAEPSQTPPPAAETVSSTTEPSRTEPVVEGGWIPIAGLAVLGAEPFGSGDFPLSNFGSDATLGFEIAGRGGIEHSLSRRLHLTADLKAYFARFGVNSYSAPAGGQEIAFGFLVGSRLGMNLRSWRRAMPYLDLHVGYFDVRAGGLNPPLAPHSAFGLEFDIGTMLWISQRFGLGPAVGLNIDMTGLDSLRRTWMTFGAEATLRFAKARPD